MPFHMWAPDAYEGAPTPVTAFMAAVVKSAAVAGMIRVFLQGLGGDMIPFGNMGWAHIFGILAAITMTAGNIAALGQSNIKRMLAYSSIAHAGVLLVGIVSTAHDPAAMGAILFYLGAYSVATLGAFGVLIWVSGGRERVCLSDLYGLGKAKPAAALVMTLCLLSFAGIPPTGGFFAKFYLFKAALLASPDLLWLVVVGVLNSMISIYYYLKIVMAMYFRDSESDVQTLSAVSVRIVVILCAILVLWMGVMPSHWQFF